MRITSSYGVELRKINKLIKPTIDIYRKSVDFLLVVFESVWDVLSEISNSQKQFNEAERLIHNTSRNTAKYDFDDRFPKFPSYLRRSAVKAALGMLSSYHSNLYNWEKSGSKGARPSLPKTVHKMPVFYRDNMYKEGAEPYTAFLKLYVRNDWVWVQVQLKKTDIDYIRRYWSHAKASAPVLEKRYRKYFLRFSFEENVRLPITKLEDQVICAIDLGLNTDAVCSIMCANGTVLARKFIDFPSDKDHLGHMLNRIKKHQREHGNSSVKGFWRYARNCNTEHAKRIAAAIVSFAMEYFTDVIVFEHLDMNGKKSGSKKQKLHMWRKNSVQEFVTHKAHKAEIRVSHVSARNTSKLAFDGSGEVIRDKKNHSLCTFSTGKQYNCDLSASYNIGARYFIREILKPLPETVRSSLLAKVPEAERRTICTLNTLRQVSVLV